MSRTVYVVKNSAGWFLSNRKSWVRDETRAMTFVEKDSAEEWALDFGGTVETLETDRE